MRVLVRWRQQAWRHCSTSSDNADSIVQKLSWNEFQTAAWKLLRPLCPSGGVPDLVARAYDGSPLVFTGREEQMEQLQQEIEVAFDLQEERPFFITLEGFSGAGKSRMLLEAPYRAGVPVHPLKSKGVLSVLIDFNASGRDAPRAQHLQQLEGETFLSMAVLCRAFLGIRLDDAYMKLACIDNGVQQLQLSFADVIEMIVTFHRAKQSLEKDQKILFFLLLDEFQLLRPLLQDRGLTAQAAQDFVTDACEAMYNYRVSVAKSQNCALFPLCAGTLIRDMTPSFGVSRWGKKPIALPLLPIETGVKMLASSLGENWDNVLHSEGMKTLLNDVMVIPRFLRFIHLALAKPHIREQSRAGKVEDVVRAVRVFVEEEIYVRFGQHVGSEWKMIMYYCLTGMPVKLEQIEVAEAAFRGYVFLESFRGDKFRVRMPFALMQLFWFKLELPTLLDWFGEPLQKGDELEDSFMEMLAVRVKVLQHIGKVKMRLDEVLVGIEGNEAVLGQKLCVPFPIVFRKDDAQLISKGNITRRLETVLGVIYKSMKNAMGIDVRMAADCHKVCVFQLKGWEQDISYVGSKRGNEGQPADVSIYNMCKKMNLSMKTNWIGVVILTSGARGTQAEKERLFRDFPRLAILSGEHTRNFFPRTRKW